MKISCSFKAFGFWVDIYPSGHLLPRCLAWREPLDCGIYDAYFVLNMLKFGVCINKRHIRKK